MVPLVVRVPPSRLHSSSHSHSKRGALSLSRGSNPRSGSRKSSLRFRPNFSPNTHLRFALKSHAFSALLTNLLHRFLWGIATLLLGVYKISQDLIVNLIVQPQLFSFFSLRTRASTCTTAPALRSRRSFTAELGGTLVLWGVLEAGIVLALRVCALCSAICSDLV